MVGFGPYQNNYGSIRPLPWMLGNAPPPAEPPSNIETRPPPVSAALNTRTDLKTVPETPTGPVTSVGNQYQIRSLGISERGMQYILYKEGWDGNTRQGPNGERLTQAHMDRLVPGVLTIGPGVTHGIEPGKWYTDQEIHAMKMGEMQKVLTEASRAEIYAKMLMAQRGGITAEQAANPDFHIWNQAVNDMMVSAAYNLGAGNMNKLMAGQDPGIAGLAGLMHSQGVITADGKFNAKAFTEALLLKCHVGGPNGTVVPGLLKRRQEESQVILANAGPPRVITANNTAPNTTQPQDQRAAAAPAAPAAVPQG
jgi:GH24 family phage-related lysozyme (muramidase)